MSSYSVGNRSVGLEWLRVICMFLVIINHLVAQFYSIPGTSDVFKQFWKINTPMISFGMPMFFFISGMLLMRQFRSGKLNKMSFSAFFHKKFVRLMVPYIVFTAITMLWYRFFDINAFTQLNFWHLWFLPTLMWCCCLSFLYMANVRMTHTVELIVNAVLLVLCLALPFVKVTNVLALDSVAYWIFTFVGGMLFERYRPVHAKLYSWGVAVVLSSAVYITVWTFMPWEYRGEPSLSYMLSLLVLMGSICGMVENFDMKADSMVHQVVLFIAAFSFGIYNVHYLIIGMTVRRPIMKLLDYLHVNDATTPGLLVIIQCVLVLLISMGLCWGYGYGMTKIKKYISNKCHV